MELQVAIDIFLKEEITSITIPKKLISGFILRFTELKGGYTLNLEYEGDSVIIKKINHVNKEKSL